MPILRGLRARLAAVFSRTLPVETPVVRLDEVRRRLEVLLAALYGQAIPIVPLDAARAASGRRMARPPAHLRATDPVAAGDGERIHLPPQLDASDGVDAALARYRVMAVGQAERMMRGTATLAPDEPLARDLYLLLESAAADAAITDAVPGMRPALQAERAAALARRPPPEGLTEAEREVETLVRALLAADTAAPPSALSPGATPAESLERARALAERLRTAHGRYRGVPAVAAWGTLLPMVAIAGAAGLSGASRRFWPDGSSTSGASSTGVREMPAPMRPRPVRRATVGTIVIGMGRTSAAPAIATMGSSVPHAATAGTPR
ncbi:MAG TPA: hypothetical protein VM759_03425 [Longimicrobium sp.]|nr:hypothetical protein [Longimicrobium sp.]